MTRRRDVVVGLVIVFGLTVGVVGTIWLQGSSIGRDTRTVDALFSEVGMLMRGNTVKLRGVAIGRVDEITVEPSGEAVRVTLRVDAEVAFPSGFVSGVTWRQRPRPEGDPDATSPSGKAPGSYRARGLLLSGTGAPNDRARVRAKAGRND